MSQSIAWYSKEYWFQGQSSFIVSVAMDSYLICFFANIYLAARDFYFRLFHMGRVTRIDGFQHSHTPDTKGFPALTVVNGQ